MMATTVVGDGVRRRSLECFLAGEDNALGQRSRRKSDEYFGSDEAAIDMRRRCTSNDSGEWRCGGVKGF